MAKADEFDPTLGLPEGGPPPAPIGTELRAGDEVDGYVIRERLGVGGFAIVYLAEQVTPVRRRVALKIIKPGMDSREVIARFEAERQALALMDHPNVAKVFDAGTTARGVPYFVMELVPGVPVTEYCDRHRLTVDDRLALFIKVCKAVQHAHQKGIIHRDLKPSNILVTEHDGEVVPKVIDFGVAKALHQRLTPQTVYTAQGHFIGTPAYMSPEQSETTAQDIDTRSDIYSLGVILYETLTGALPFDPTTSGGGSFNEFQRMIREDDPPRPSTRLSGLGDASAVTARKRHADISSLVRELRGDLDWIVMKCLEKDRTRRYETANGLAADVQRHLDDEPVAASPPSAAYRLSKFVRRHRTGVTAAAIVGMALLGATAVSVMFALAEAEQRRIALAEARRADAERAVARSVNEFLTEDLLSAVAPSAEAGRGKDVLMIDVLDEAAARIEDASRAGGRFDGQPLVEASIRMTLGETYRQLGAYTAAEPHLVRAQLLYKGQFGDEHRLSLQADNEVAVIWQSQGRLEEAESLHRETLELRRRVLGDDHRDTLASINNLAALYRSQNRIEEAEPLQIELLERSERALGPTHERTLTAKSSLAQLHVRKGDNAAAVPLFVDVLETQRRELGEEHPSTLISMSLLAEVYRRLDRADQAEPLLVRALAIQQRLLGDDHQDTIMTAVNLANLLRRDDRLDEAEALLEPTVEACRRTLGDEHQMTLNAMQILSTLYDDQGRLDKAEPLMLAALETRERTLPADHPQILTSKSNLARLYMKQGQFERAKPLLMEAVAGSRRSLPAGHWYQGIYLLRYGECLLGQRAFEEAERVLLESQQITAAALGDEHSRTMAVVRMLVSLYTEWEKPEEVERWQLAAGGPAH